MLSWMGLQTHCLQPTSDCAKITAMSLQGLLTHKWLLRGKGHTVDKDANITYTHKALPIHAAKNGVH